MSRSFEVIRNAQQDQPDYPLHIDRSVLTQQRLNEWLGRGDSPKPPSALAQLRKAARQTARFFAPDCLKSKFSRKRADEYPADHSSDDQSKQVRKQSARVFATWLVSFFPFIATLRKYDVKNSFVNDLIAGITVGIMHVPQGMAYAMLATLPPVIGLYTSFFPALVYFFFGTSRHISMGTIAVVSLLTGEFLDKMVPSQLDLRASASSADLNHSFLMASNDSLDPTALRVRYATALTMTVGISQFAMGIFRMGSVIRYLSGPMTSGFTVGVATHVLTSQVTTLLGVKIPKPVGLFTVPRTYYEVIRAIRTANPVTIGLSACCILIIAVFKVWINPPVTRRIRVPIPIDLIIVILATVTSQCLQLNSLYQVKVVGHVSKGIQSPELPNLDQMENAIADIVVLAVISFSVNTSLVRIFAKTHNYKTDCNQELYAYGLSNIVSSFFQTYPAAASLSRSAVQVSAGGRTQVATLFSSVLLILVLFFIGPLFYHVPNCCLSAIIVVALKGMFIHAVDLKYLWKYSIWDFTVWLLTFFCTMIFDLKYGLLTGIAFSALTVILRTQAPPTRILGQVDGTELYRDVRGAGGKCVQPSIIKVIRYEGSIYYTCAEHFRLSVYQRVGLDPLYVFNRIKKLQARLRHVEKALGLESSEFFSARKVTTGASPNRPTPDAKDTDTIKHVVVSADGDQSKHSLGAFYTSVVPVPTEEGTNKTFSKLERRRTKLIRNLARLEEKCHLQFVVLDCSCWSFVDYMGADELNQLVKEFRQLDIHVLLAQLNDNIVQSLHRNGKLPSDTELFPTVHDAVLWAVGRIQTGPNHLHNVHDVVDTYNRLVMNQFENLDCSADDDEEDDQENGDNHHGGDIENNEHHPVREDMITPNQIGYKSAQHEPNERDNDSPTPV